MKNLELYDGKGNVIGYTLLDDEDYAKFSQYRWYLRTRGYAGRGKRVNGVFENHFLSREILGLKPFDPTQVDHINKNTLDNRKANLRLVTHAQNMQNKKSYKGSASRSRGVSFYRPSKRWRARVQVNGKTVFCQYYALEAEAAEGAKMARARLMTHAID